jgi:hypothetical protein
MVGAPQGRLPKQQVGHGYEPSGELRVICDLFPSIEDSGEPIVLE